MDSIFKFDRNTGEIHANFGGGLKSARNALLPLHGPMLALLESAVIADDPDLKREIIEFPVSSELQSVDLDLLILLLRTAASNRRPSHSAALGLEGVRERCMRALTARLNEPSQRAARPTTGRTKRRGHVFRRAKRLQRQGVPLG